MGSRRVRKISGVELALGLMQRSGGFGVGVSE